MSLLVAKEAARAFGIGRHRRAALGGCSFEAARGEIVGVVGPNGAGKTTLLRLVAGDIGLTSGSMLVAGFRAGTRAARRCVGVAPDPPVVPPELTGTEWLTYLASHRATSCGEATRLVAEAVELAELQEFAGRGSAGYSRGMLQRLALAAATIAGTDVVVLDETLGGIDPLVHRRLRHQVMGLAERGRLVLIASHDLGAVERLATRVLVLVRGVIRADVPTARLVAERVAEITLTGSALAGVGRLLSRYRGSVRTGAGLAVPLSGGLTVEQVLAACRQDRIAVAASRVRYRALEDILVDAVGVDGRLA
jgi:ABC-2 type transport system ATP-binding protein